MSFVSICQLRHTKFWWGGGVDEGSGGQGSGREGRVRGEKRDRGGIFNAKEWAEVLAKTTFLICFILLLLSDFEFILSYQNLTMVDVSYKRYQKIVIEKNCESGLIYTLFRLFNSASQLLMKSWIYLWQSA